MSVPLIAGKLAQYIAQLPAVADTQWYTPTQPYQLFPVLVSHGVLVPPAHLSRRRDKLNKSDAAWAIEGVPIETNPNLNIYKLKYFIEPFFRKFKKSALHILHLRDWLITWPFLIDESAIAP